MKHTKFPLRKTLLAAALIGGVVLYNSCGESATQTNKLGAEAPSPEFIFSPTPPTDIMPNAADSLAAAMFAWQEFIAMTWPTKVNPNSGPGLFHYFRGQPSLTDSPGSTGP